MKAKSSIETVKIEKFSHDGRGIARILGKSTFIEGGLPDETVMFERRRQKKDFDEGVAVEILEPSSKRVTPLCPHYGVCGGCSLQHLVHVAQIHEKQTLLLEILQRIGHCQPSEILAPLLSEPWHYRNKARLSVRHVVKKGSTLVGFREKINPRYVADIHVCPVLHAKVGSKIDEFRALIDALEDPASIAQIEVAAGDEDVALIIRHLKPLSESSLAILKAFGEKTNFRLFLQPKGPDSVKLFFPDDGREFLTYALPDFNIQYSFHPTDFTQVNAGINQAMVSLAMQLLSLKSSDLVLDLFCGLGNFSLPIATLASGVIGIEGSETMVNRAKMNAQANHLNNTDFFCADLETWSMQDERIASVNKLLIDPPRCGAFEIVKQMDVLNPELLVYVSCNPGTLARDADVLVNQKGYHLQAAGVMDMFPHTAHVESIALFVKR